jgi:haloalkane dehalogenase
MLKKVLLTTIHRPLGIEDETCTPNITAEAYNAQITREQGPFGIHALRNGVGLDFIASNLDSPVTVLHYPTKKRFVRELKKGYDYVGISFIICTFPKAVELCGLVRQHAPQSKIVLGGYGTVLQECDQHADYVCRGEGVNFFKRLLGEDEVETFKIPLVQKSNRILSVTTQPETIIPVGLGCPRGCDFCCTSHFFDQNYFPLIRTGREIHDLMASVPPRKKTLRNFGVIDEDFLADRRKIMDMAELNATEVEKPILFSCFTSLKSLSQYTDQEFLMMGLSGVWVGAESKRADYSKLQGLDVHKILAGLKLIGVNVLVSMVLGYDWHDPAAVEEDFEYLLSLKPALSQFMICTPCPQTPLYERVKREGRLLNIPFKYHDGFHALIKHPHFSQRELEDLVIRLLRREHEELGPSIFRIMETQLSGYEYLKENPSPLLKARAGEHRRLCLDIYPLLRMGIKKAPSPRVKSYLKGLRDRVEDQFRIPAAAKLKSPLVPVLYFYTRFRDRISFLNQPPSEVHRYRL